MAEEILDDNIPQQEPTRKIPTPDEVLGKQPTTATRRVPTPDDVFGTVKKNTSSPSTNNSQSLDGSSTSQLEGNKQPSFDFNKTFGEIGVPKNISESTKVVQPLKTQNLANVLPVMKENAVRDITLQRLQKQGKVPLVGTNDYNAEKAFVQNNIQDADWMPHDLLQPVSQEKIKKEAVSNFAAVNNEKPEDVEANLQNGKYKLEDGKVKEVGGFADNFSQGVRDFVNNVGLGMNVSAAQSRGNDNEAKYYLNEFNKNKKNERETTANDALGKGGKMLGGLAPYALTSAVMPGADIPLMGLSNMGENHQQIWNDPNLSEDQKIKAINNTSTDAFMTGSLQGAAFHSIGAGEPKVTASSLLSKYAPTANLKQKFTQNLYNSFGDLLKTTPSDVAKAASIGAGTELLNDMSKSKEGVKVDFSNVPEAALQMGALDLIMKAPKVLTHAYGVLKDAVSSGYDKVNPDWYNRYSKQTQDALNAIVAAPDKVYTQAIAQLDASPDPAAANAKQKIKTFRDYYNSLPSDLSNEAKNKALHILQLKTEAIQQMNDAPDDIKSIYQGRAKAYDGLLNKLVEEGNIDTKKEPLLLPRFVASLPEKQNEKPFVDETKQVQQSPKVTEPITQEINQPIGEAKETKREGKESIVPEHNNIETNPNYRTAYAGNHEGEQEFTHFILNGKKYPIDGNEELLKNNPDAKLDKSKESQTETKKQQTENIKKFNVPLDEGTQNPKGETMQDFVGRVVSEYEKDKSQQPDNSVIVAHSSVLKALKTYEALKDKPLFKNADWDNLTDEQAKAFTDHYTKESTNNGDIEIYDNGKGGKIKIARHGQTEDNLTGKFRNDETNLTPKGIQQAKEVGAKLGEKPPKIISSDLPRAIHTANLAMGEIVTPTEKVLPKEETKSITPTVSEQKAGSGVVGGDVPKVLQKRSPFEKENIADNKKQQKDKLEKEISDLEKRVSENNYTPKQKVEKSLTIPKPFGEGEPKEKTIIKDGETYNYAGKTASKKNYIFELNRETTDAEKQKSVDEQMQEDKNVLEYKKNKLSELNSGKLDKEIQGEIDRRHNNLSEQHKYDIARTFYPNENNVSGIRDFIFSEVGGNTFDAKGTNTKYIEINGKKVRFSDHESRSEQDASDPNKEKFRPQEYEPEDINVVLTKNSRSGDAVIEINGKPYNIADYQIENIKDLGEFVYEKIKDDLAVEQSLKETTETKSITPNTETTEQVESGNPPIQPPNGEEKNVANGQEEGSLITKEELSKYEGAKKLFEEEGKTTWNAVVGRAIQRLIKNNPDKSLEDAAKSHVDRLAALYDEGKAINPTAEDLAIINYAKLKTDEKIASLKDWDSDNSTDRINALAKLDELNKDLLKIAKAANPREAGLAFGIRQMLLSMKNGLQIRRMELSKDKGGNKLNESEMEFTREQWSKEKRLLEEKQELEKKSMQERFDAEIKKHEESYAKLLEQKGKVEEGAKIAKKRQDVLKQKGKELADKLRSGIQKGTYSDPFLIGKSLNFIISKVADMVEGGATLAAAIDKFVSDNKIESRRKQVEDAIFNHLDRQSKREDAITKIKEDIDANKSTTITKDMVRSNTIKDFVNSYVNTVPLDQVSDVAFHQLKELLPDITKDKFKEAYLKEGEYKIETEKELRNQSVDEQRRYNRLVEAESKLRELKKTRNLLKEDDFIRKAKVDAEIEKINNKIKDDLINSGQKVSSKSNVDKEELASRATKHNSNIDEVVSDINGKLKNANEKTRDTVNDLLKKLEEAKIDYNKESKLDQTKKVENATEKIDLIQKRLDVVKNSIGKDLAYDIELGLQKVKDRFDAAKQESEQNILLRDAKQDAITKKNETQRRINAGEFDNSTPKKVLTKSDAELVKNQIELGKVQSAYNKKADQLKKDNRKWYSVLGEVGRSAFVNGLIGTPKTFVNLTLASPLKIATTYLSKLTTGKLGEHIFNEGLLTRAKEGGESSSWQAMNEGIRAVFQHTDMKKLDAKISEDNEAFKKAADKYENEKDPIKKAELKKQADEALRKAVGNEMYKYVGTSVFKTFADKLLHRNSQLESMLGNEHGEEFIPVSKIKDYKDVADNISYILGFVGRSHGALKSPSARYHFAAGFMSRLEAAMERGEDIRNPAKLQEMAADSFTDWNSGMYQQDNWVTNFGNKVIWDLKNSDNHFAKALGHAASWDVAITKVPVNMINEMIFDMTLGLPTSLAKYGKEYYKANKMVKAELPDANSYELKEALREQLSKMDKKTAVDIVRMFRHGGFALGILGLALASKSFKYGGFAHKGQTKEDEKKKEGELKTGELSIGDKVLNKYITSSLTHTTGMFPLLAYLNAQHDFKKYKGEDNTDKKAALKTGVNLLEHIVNTYPQSKIVNPITISKDTYSNVKSALGRLNKAYNPNYEYDAGTSEKTSKEYNFLKEHNESIKDYPIESLHPINQYGKEVPVTDEKYKQFLEERKNIIKKEIETLISGQGKIVGKNGSFMNLSKDEADKLTSDQLKPYLMRITKEADKQAMYHVFKGQEKPKSTKEGEVYTH